MEVVYFTAEHEFRSWLEANHLTAKELTVGYHKVGSGKPSMTWSGSVDVALCYGWIDGIRRSVDAERYTIRFTPRKPGSNWSLVNLAKVEELIARGLMQPAGMDAYNRRKDSKTGVYRYESGGEQTLDEQMIEIFTADAEAWKYFQLQSPSYKRAAISWVMAARQPETRLRRLTELVASSSRQEYIRAMRWQKKKPPPPAEQQG